MSHAHGQDDQHCREPARGRRRLRAAAHGQRCNGRPPDYNGDASYLF
jgi:hypothetical protein